MIGKRYWLALLAVCFAGTPLAWSQDEASEEAPAPAAAEAPAETPAVDTSPTRAELQAQRGASIRESRQREAELRQVVAQIVLEARELDELKEPSVPPQFRRIHPALRTAGAGPDDALIALNLMQQNWTDNPYRDTYIRWHLMAVVRQGSEADREEMGRRLLSLLQKLPGAISIPRRSEYKDEPPEIAAQYHRIVNALRVTDGYPPFQRTVGPPQSLQLMDPSRREAGEKEWAKAQELRTQWERIHDREAIAFNRRVSEINELILNYQGELIFELIKTGDPEMLKVVGREIDKQARAKSGLQFVLLNFTYQAAFAGHLNRYTKEALTAFSMELERTAKANEEWVEIRRRQRNFADYAFHMIHMLRDGGGFIDPKELEEGERQRGGTRFRSRAVSR